MDSRILFLAFFPMLAIAGESPYPAANHPQAPSHVQHEGAVSFPTNIWADEHPGYAVQTGYEGYLVPAESLGIKDIIKTAGFVAAIPIVAKVALKLALKAGIAILGLGAVVSIAVILTYLLCACTPVCKLTFHHKLHKFDRESVRSLVSSDTLDSAANFLSSAIAKYQDSGDKTQEAKKLQ